MMIKSFHFSSVLQRNFEGRDNFVLFSILWAGRQFQWDLNTELVWYLNGPKEVWCQMAQYLNAI